MVDRYSGNVPDAYAMSTARSHVWLMLIAAIVVDFAATITPERGKVASQARAATHHQVNVIGWGVLFVFMTMLTDFPATTALAEAFALLILLAALFLHAESAAKNVNRWIAGPTKTVTPTKAT